MKIIPHFSAEGLSNVYLIVDDGGNGAIVDPAHVDKEILELIESTCSSLVAILITHKHKSHTAGLGTLMKIYNPTIYAFGTEVNSYRAQPFADGETKRIGEMDVKAIHVPGHSLDSLAFLIDSALFTGDTLFRGSVGRCDLGGDEKELRSSLTRLLETIDDDVRILPGHGPMSSFGYERTHNPFLI